MVFTSIWYNVFSRIESETDLPLGLFVSWCSFKEISGMLFTSLVLALGLFRIPVPCDIYFSKDFVLRSSGRSIESCSFASSQNISLSEYLKTYEKSPCNGVFY